jgi:putative NADH-flavin reductase
MHLVVSGASGATGRLVVEQAVAAGHRVTVLVRDPGRFRAPAGVHVVAAQVVDDPGVTLPDGADAVVSALGKRSAKDPAPVCTDGVRNLVAAMRRKGVRRIVAVSASPVLRTGYGEPWWFRRVVRPAVHRLGRDLYADLEGMERTLRAADADLDWTVLRPGYLVDHPAAGYRLVQDANAVGNVHRADLAAALLSVVGDPATAGHAYGLASAAS